MELITQIGRKIPQIIFGTRQFISEGLINMKDFDISKFKANTQTLLTKAEKRIAELKESTAKKLLPEFADKFSASDLADRANILGTTEGYASVMRRASNTSEKCDYQFILLYFSREGCGYSNDQWSGRCNDFRRSVNDGEKQAIRDILDLLEHGSCLSL